MVLVVQSFATSEIGDAERVVRGLYPESRLEDPVGDFAFSLDLRGDESVVLARMRFSSRLRIRVSLEGATAFGVWRAGSYACASNGRYLRGSDPVAFGPTDEATSESEGLDQSVVSFSEGALARRGAAALGVDAAGTRLLDAEPIDERRGRLWRAAVIAAEEILADDLHVQDDLIREATFDHLARLALACFPMEHRARRWIVQPNGPAAASTRRAQRFIEDHADQAVTVTDVAMAAGLSLRGLNAAFRRDLDTTPLAYLQRVRLSAVRADLLAAREGTTVAATARRWGFAHLGRFAALYRTVYGELPGQTLRGTGRRRSS